MDDGDVPILKKCVEYNAIFMTNRDSRTRNRCVAIAHSREIETVVQPERQLREMRRNSQLQGEIVNLAESLKHW